MINIPEGAKEAALEAAEELSKETRKVFNNFVSQVSCTDNFNALQQGLDCTPLDASGNKQRGDVTLDWRSDPFISMSDLTLVIYDGSTQGGVYYHVHTLLLAYGGRKSGFIAEQIKNSSNRINNKNNSMASSSKKSSGIYRQESDNSARSQNSNAEYKVDIYLPTLASQHIPLFLDYIYGSQLKLTTNNASSLRYLSNRFDVRELHKEITTKFIPSDLEINTASTYCIHSDILKDFELRDKSIRIIAEKFGSVNVKLLKDIIPKLMRSIISCDRLDCGNGGGGSSIGLSENIAEYIRLRDDMSSTTDNSSGGKNNVNREASLLSPTSNSGDQDTRQSTPSISDEDFYWLTHVQYMPRISPKEALFYYNYGSQYTQVMSEVGSGSLKSRCLVANCDMLAIDKLTTHLEHSEHNKLELYSELEMKNKVELLESTLVGARKLLSKKDEEYNVRNEQDRDVQLSNEMMFKNNRESYSAAAVSNSDSVIMKVVVLGSGVEPANGVYIYKGHVSSPTSNIVYKKEAIWNQQPVTFLLYPTQSGQFYTQYKLGVRSSNNDCKQKNERIKVLYNSPTVMSSAMGTDGGSGGVIPEQAWEVENEEGLQPAPQFVGRIEQPQASRNWKEGMKRSLP